MQVKFKKPPINEVAIGVYFENELQEFRSEHVGLFWSRIRDEFPTCRQQPVISPPVFGGLPAGFEITVANEVFPMPRYHFEAADGVTLIQVQKNGFLFNWRKRDADYPHFDAVKAAFDKNYNLFTNFLEEEVPGVQKPAIQIADLTYINLIDAASGYWNEPKDTAAVFPAFSMPLHMNAPFDFNQTAKFTFAPDLAVTVVIRNGKAPTERVNPVLLFELRALGVLGSVGKGQADEWFGRAHDAIGSCFLEMTSPDIQRRFWERP
jgi:uncharacterized protein (TIGR04255 family)